MNNAYILPIVGIVWIIATIVMIIAINQELYLEKACRVNFNHSEAICARIGILWITTFALDH